MTTVAESLIAASQTLQGYGVVVTGAASGLGAATAQRLAAAGAYIVVADLQEGRGTEMAAALGGRFVRTNRLVRGSGEASALEAFQSVIDINLIGTINVLRLAAQSMAANEPTADGERGVCIMTSSIAAFEGQVGQVAYAASKAGVAGMALAAARDLADRGIRVNAIAPGVFGTPMFLDDVPEAAQENLLGNTLFPARAGKPEEFAHLVEHIITNPMLNGEVIRLDGGIRMPAR
jgi:NAD(P)-dependent dehydrogenase (short-subunit alcohol dehydrogenase family)